MVAVKSELTFAYPAVFEKTGGTVLVSFPDLPEALTEGDDAADAADQATDCLDEAIAGRIARREAIPAPSRAKRGQQLIVVPDQTALKAALHIAVREAGLTNVQLATRLGCDEKEVRRMLNPRHATRMARMHEGLLACGKVVRITMCDVAPRERLLRAPNQTGRGAIRAARAMSLGERRG